MKSITKLVYIVLVIVEVTLILRFIFLLVGASEVNFIVFAIVQSSGWFIYPFKSVLDVDWSIGKFFIDIDALVSLVIYMVLGFGIAELIKVLSYGS